MRSFLILAFAIFMATTAKSATITTTDPVGFIRIAPGSIMFYGFNPRALYVVKAQWRADDKSCYFILAFEVTMEVKKHKDDGSVSDETLVSDRPTIIPLPVPLPPIGPDYDGTLRCGGIGGAVLLHNVVTGKDTMFNPKK